MSTDAVQPSDASLPDAPAAVQSEESQLVTRADFLYTDDATYKTVPVPELGRGKVVRLRSLSIENRIELERRMAANKANKNDKGQPDPMPELHGVGEWLLVQACVDSEGHQILTDKDAAALSKRNASMVQRLVGITLKLADDDVQAAAKN